MAQTRFEVSGGYALAHDSRDQVTLPAGWIAGAAIGLTPAFAAVVDVSGQYKTVALLNADARLSLHTAMAGVRASARLGRLTSSVKSCWRRADQRLGVRRDDYRARDRHPARSRRRLSVDAALAHGGAGRPADRRAAGAQNAGTQLRFAACLVYRHP